MGTSDLQDDRPDLRQSVQVSQIHRIQQQGPVGQTPTLDPAKAGLHHLDESAHESVSGDQGSGVPISHWVASIRDYTKMELHENPIVLMSMCKTPWAGVLMISYSRKFKGWWTRKQGYREISAALAWD